MALAGEILGKGVLQVHLVSARDLYNTEFFGTMDPYVSMQLDTDKRKLQKTTPCKDGGKTPTWDQKLTFTYEGEKNLDIELYDKDTMSSDDFIGHYRFPIRDIVKSRGAFDGEVTLVRGKSNKFAGRLRLKINLHGGDAYKEQPKTPKPAPAAAAAPVPVQPVYAAPAPLPAVQPYAVAGSMAYQPPPPVYPQVQVYQPPPAYPPQQQYAPPAYPPAQYPPPGYPPAPQYPGYPSPPPCHSPRPAQNPYADCCSSDSSGGKKKKKSKKDKKKKDKKKDKKKRRSSSSSSSS